MNQEKIGKFIAKCRKEKGLTQMQLAEKLGVTNRAVSKWENGKNMPDIATIIPLCEILDISVNEFLGGERITMKNDKKMSENNVIQILQEVEKKLTENKMLKLAVLLLVVGIISLLAFAFGEDIGRFFYSLIH